MNNPLLTPKAVAALKPGESKSDPAERGAGRLQARAWTGGVNFVYRYTAPDGSRVRLPLGAFDPQGRDGPTLKQARAKAADLAKLYQSGNRDLRGLQAAEQQGAQRQREAAERQRKAEARAAEVAAASQQATLGALLNAYVEQLRRDAKPSAREVELSLNRHIRDAWPLLWATPASDIAMEDGITILSRLVGDGKLREAAKLRSYMRAAFAAAIRARQSAHGLQTLRALRITANPVRDLMTVKGANKVRERALSVAELRCYWRRIAALPGPGGAMLRFHLLTGGQRIDQLGRTTTADIDVDAHTLRLRDPKGRRETARVHTVPMLPEAETALEAMASPRLGPFLFTATFGERGAVYATAHHRVRAVAEAMVKAGEAASKFTLGDLRRTVETRLAALGVSREIRGHLQSHGLGGVQARHYDRHDYLTEKRAALERLRELLTSEPATVVPIKARA